MESVELHRTQIRENGFALAKTSGKSMRPLIWGRHHCVVGVPLEGDPEPGDLLLFGQKAGGREIGIVHRVIGKRESGGEILYITRGDNSLAEETVRRSEIIGRVAEVHRLSGFRPWYAVPFRKFAVTDRYYRIYVRIWGWIWPARRLYYRIRERASRFLSKPKR